MREIGLDLEDTSECLTNNRKNRGQRDLLLLFFLVLLVLNFIQFGLIKIALIIFSREIVQQLSRNACKEECHYRTWNNCYKKDPGK